MKKRSAFILLLFIGTVYPKTAFADKESLVPCTGEVNTDWVRVRQDGIIDELLFRFAVSQAGVPVRCEAKITAMTEDGQFGSIVYHFNDGITYTSESFPPESSGVSLKAPRGFKNEKDAVRQLKETTAKIGLRIDWTKPHTKKSGETETTTFWDPAEGTNGRGVLSYKNGKLISIGFGMAL